MDDAVNIAVAIILTCICIITIFGTIAFVSAMWGVIF